MEREAMRPLEVAKRISLTSVTSRQSRRSSSFLRPAGNCGGAAPPRELGFLSEIGLLAFFVLTRAVHPVIIASAQVEPAGGGKPVAPYALITPVLGECLFTLMLGQLLCLAIGGVSQWRKIWDPAPMKVFSFIGFVYAWGDVLEVYALASVSGDSYQVLLQSKLLITALMMRLVKGTRQTRLQWIILGSVMTSMSFYMTAGNFKNCSRDADAAPTGMSDAEFMFAIGIVALKVVISCLCAVLSDKYLKEYSGDPVHMQLVRLNVSWTLAILAYTFFDGETWDFESRSGPLTGWGAGACAVLASFAIKGWSSMYLLAFLDSLLKNIGEALSVLVTYALAVWAFQKTEYNTPTLLMVLTVTGAVIVYIDSKGVIEKAKMFEVEQGDACF